jgi:hypothetical protein
LINRYWADLLPDFLIRSVDFAGALWPHRITSTTGDEVTEEMTFGDFEVNRPLNPKKFEGEEKR